MELYASSNPLIVILLLRAFSVLGIEIEKDLFHWFA